jgi:hypothetical protein
LLGAYLVEAELVGGSEGSAAEESSSISSSIESIVVGNGYKQCRGQVEFEFAARFLFFESFPL